MSETQVTVKKETEEARPLTHRHETLFLWDVRKSNPNGDPNGNEPRIDRHTKKCDVTDVCIKRSVRDYLARKHGVGALLVTRLGEDVSRIVTLTERIEELARQEDLANAVNTSLTEIGFNPEGIQARSDEVSRELKELKGQRSKDKDDDCKRLEQEQQTLKEIAKFLTEKSTKSLKALLENDTLRSLLVQSLRKLICRQFYDLRMFGSVLAIRSGSDLAELGGPLTGPIQVEIGTSLHRVVQSNKQITSVMAPDKKQNASEEGEEAEHGGGLFGDTHGIEYGLFVTSAIANEHAAVCTGLTDQDHEMFLKSLWRGTRERHTRSKNAIPRLLIDIEYSKPFHCGDLISMIELEPVERDGKKLEEEQLRDVRDFSLKLDKLYAKLKKHKAIIKKIRFASSDLRVHETVPDTASGTDLKRNDDLLTLDVIKKGLGDGLQDKAEGFENIDYDAELTNQQI